MWRRMVLESAIDWRWSPPRLIARLGAWARAPAMGRGGGALAIASACIFGHESNIKMGGPSCHGFQAFDKPSDGRYSAIILWWCTSTTPATAAVTARHHSTWIRNTEQFSSECNGEKHSYPRGEVRIAPNCEGPDVAMVRHGKGEKSHSPPNCEKNSQKFGEAFESCNKYRADSPENAEEAGNSPCSNCPAIHSITTTSTVIQTVSDRSVAKDCCLPHLNQTREANDTEILSVFVQATHRFTD